MDIDNDNETVQQILQGSKNIDRMRSEIETFVRMILGLVTKMGLESYLREDYQNCRDMMSRSEDCRWRLFLDSEGTFHVECWVIENLGEGLSLIYSTQPDSEVLYSRLVHLVHKNLGVFLSGMEKIFPSLGIALRPYLEAADPNY